MKIITLQSCLKGLTGKGWSKIASVIVLVIVASGRILKCFHKRYYEVSMDVFLLVDGEYHPKQADI